VTTEQIKQLIADGERLTVEFKKCTDALNNSVFETVCAFSNRYGGHILLGVDDDGTITGVNRSAAASMKSNFVNMLNNPQRLAPTLYLNLEEITINRKTILCA
jgi:ATP-dependent DNA helicase RecG